MDILKNRDLADPDKVLEKNGDPGDRAQINSTIIRDEDRGGEIVVTFSENDLDAWMDFIPLPGKDAFLTPDYIASILERLNIVYGVRWEAIQEEILQYNTDKRPLKGLLVAKGDRPETEVAEFFELNPHLSHGLIPAEDQDRVDYRSYSPFVIVKQDQILAWKRPRKTGRNGKNIHDVVIPYGITRPEGVSGGENTQTGEKGITALINGQLIRTQNVLSVRDSLMIKGSVGYATGNIIFPGDVVIEGTVSDGFKIYSGGSVTIKQTFDVTDVITKKDLTVTGGIIGRGRALVKVGGALRTKFIENCRVACRKTITIDSEIINSSVYTMENLDMGDRGFILGSEIYSIHGIRAAGIGKKSGKATHIHCGIDFTIQQEKEKNNNNMRLLAGKLSRLRELMTVPEPNPEKRAKLEELLHRLEGEQKKIGLRIADIMGKLDTDENARIEVSGEIAPGTLIEICQIALFVSEPLKKIRIKLDKASGKLITEPL
ncbi:MAG: FapA family protein [Treponema sp.]|nr:FapA family protein [Treponema sp.]